MIATLSPARTARLWVGAYLIGTLGSGLALRAGLTQGWFGWALFLASFLLIVPLVRAVQHLQATAGLNSPAMRAYNRRVLIASLAYVVLLFSGISIAVRYDPPALIRVVLAVAAAAPIIFVIRAMALLLKEEKDEYLRMRLVEQSLFATGFLLTLATLYGFLNAFDLAPRIDAWAVVPVWAVGLGVARIFQKDPSC